MRLKHTGRDRAPDWRVRAARNLAVGAVCNREDASDAYVKRLSEYIKLQSARLPGGVTGVSIIDAELRSPLYAAWRMHTEKGYAKRCDAVEALMLTGMPLYQIAERIDDGLDTETLRMYKLIAFDIPPLDKLFWFERYVFAPARTLEGRERVSGYIWKAVAFAAGAETFIQSCLNGHEYEDRTDEWLERHCLRLAKRKALLHCAEEYARAEMDSGEVILSKVAERRIRPLPSDGGGESKEVRELVAYMKRAAEGTEMIVGMARQTPALPAASDTVGQAVT